MERRVAAQVEALWPKAGASVDRRADSASTLVVAVSGGGDSVAVLRILKRTGYRLLAAHYDHQLRPNSGDDAAFVRDLCGSLGVELAEGTADVRLVAEKRGWNLEDAARRLRYAFLYGVLTERAPGGTIVVGHTVEDVAETVLLQALRGSAFPVGISPRHKGVIRPALGESREVLRRYLRFLGERWVEDATNAGVDRNRVWLRNRVIPELRSRYPAASERLAGLARAQREARTTLETVAAKRFPGTSIRLASYASAPIGVRKTALVARLRAMGAEPDQELLDEVDSAAMAATTSTKPWRKALPGRANIEMAYGLLEVRASTGPSGQAPGDGVLVRAVQRVEELPAEVSAAVLTEFGQLSLRAVQRGDRIRLPGGTKSVGDLLIDLKVPRAERGLLKVLAVADTDEVLWVEGVAVAKGAEKPGMPNLLGRDRHFMHLALKQAGLAAEAGEVPVGAVVVSKNGEVLAQAHNASEATGDPTAHAELLALRQAGQATGDWRLAGATLYVTLEPCVMCLGAILNTHISRLVFGAANLRDGALGGVTDLSGEGWKRTPEITGGVEARQAEKLLRQVFSAKRKG